MKGKTIIVTGASMGFGRAVAEACLAAGANVAICARTPKPLKGALSLKCDVTKPADVKRLVRDTLKKFGRIDGLVNNAGVYGPKGPSATVNLKEWRRALEINVLGTLIPCQAVLPLFKGRGKIVNLSGGGATAPLPNLSAYAASKAAVVRLTETLAVENPGIDINAIAPGALNTRLLDEVLKAGPEKVGKAFYEKSLAQKKDGGAPLEKGAALCVYLLSDESDGISGRLLSAIWDDWGNLPKSKLGTSDVYTLRRIVPKDRGWE